MKKLLFLVFIFTIAVFANAKGNAAPEIYMNPQKGAPGNAGTQKEPMSVFQEALNALPNGGTIFIEGIIENYEHKIRVKTRYYSAESPLIVDGQNKTHSAQQLSLQDCRGVVVKNMICYGGAELNNSIKSETHCLGDVMIENVTFKYGRIFAGGYTYDHITIKDCIIEENLYSGKETHGIYFSGGHWEGGIGLPHPNNINIIGNTIRFCGGRHGIQVNGCFEYVRVKGNSIYCSNFTGFQGIGIKYCEVSDNEILIGQRGCINVYDYWDGHFYDPNDPNVYFTWQKCHHPNQYWHIHHNTFLVGPHEWCWWQAGPTYVEGRPAILFNNELHGDKFWWPDLGLTIDVEYPPAAYVIENNLIVSPWPNMVEFHDPYSCWQAKVRNNMCYSYMENSTPLVCFNSDVPIDPKVYSIEALHDLTPKIYYDNILNVDPVFEKWPVYPHATEIPGMNYQMPPDASYDWSTWSGEFNLFSPEACNREKGKRYQLNMSGDKSIPANKCMASAGCNYSNAGGGGNGTNMQTAHLELMPFSPEHLLALVEGDEHFEESFGLPAAVDLRSSLVSDEVSPAWLAQLRESQAADPWVHGFAIIHQEDGVVVGNIGFKGPPDDDGVVEIDYGIVRAYQGRGYATEAAKAAVDIALGNKNVHVVRVHTLTVSNASTQVLEKCGFELTGQVDDPEDGLVWRWERSRDSV